MVLGPDCAQRRHLRPDALRHAPAASDSAAVAGFTNPAIARGRLAYIKYSCNACHGLDARGGIRNLNASSGGQIGGLMDVWETYTKEELTDRIRKGVSNVDKADPTGPDPPLKMPSYEELISGQELHDLIAYIMGFGSGQEKKKSEW